MDSRRPGAIGADDGDVLASRANICRRRFVVRGLDQHEL